MRISVKNPARQCIQNIHLLFYLSFTITGTSALLKVIQVNPIALASQFETWWKQGTFSRVAANKSLRLSCVTNSSTGSSLLQANAVKRDTPEHFSFFSFPSSTCAAFPKPHGSLYALCFSHQFVNLKPNRCFVILYGPVYDLSFLQNNSPYFAQRYKNIWIGPLKTVARFVRGAIERTNEYLGGIVKHVSCRAWKEPISVAMRRKG